ncbi:MAG: hypothetical protein V1837_01920 [Candidatus Woesearchaeota archaeon]
MKPLKFFLTAAAINLVLFILVFLQPVSPLRSFIGYLTSFFVFILGNGLRINVILSKDACILATSTGALELYQTFYEFLTIIALTIPLYLNSWRRLFEKLAAILAIMTSYYVLLYGTTILLLQNGFNVPWLLTFIKFNTESFMIFAFGLVWFFVNKTRILKIIDKLREH